MLKFYVRNRRIVDKIHEIISFKRSKWLEKYNTFNTKKEEVLKLILKDFQKLLSNAFYGKTMENVQNRLRLDFFKKCEYKKSIKQNLTYNGIHKS